MTLLIFRGVRYGVAWGGFSFTVLVLLADTALGGEGTSRCGVPDRSTIVAEFPLPVNGAPILLPVKCAGKEYLFEMDTGSPLIIFDVSLKPLLGARLEVNLPQVDGQPLDVFEMPRARVGGIALDGAGPAVCMDMRAVQFHEGDHVVGVLGMPAFQNMIVRIDSDQERLFILNAPGRDAGTRLGMKYVDGCPGLEVRIPGHGLIDAGIDTGCTGFGGVFARQVFDELRREELLADRGFAETDGLVFAGRRRVGALTLLDVGGLEYANLRIARWSDAEQQPNVLGLNWCLRNILTLDFKNQDAYIKARSRAATFADHDLSGMVFTLTTDGSIMVDDVLANSPAAKAGIQLGDLLIAIDGRAIHGAPKGPVCRSFCAYGRTLQLDIRREGRASRRVVVLPQAEAK